MTVYELCERDVVNVTTGQNLGKVDDISFEPETASITGVILYGRLKLFGLLGREEDRYIPWDRVEDTAIPWGDIEKIGTDVLLVRTAVSAPPRSRKKLFGVK